MIDKWMYKFFGLLDDLFKFLDKIFLKINNLFKKKKRRKR